MFSFISIGIHHDVTANIREEDQLILTISESQAGPSDCVMDISIVKVIRRKDDQLTILNDAQLKIPGCL